jgi:N-acyl-D-amino-acid deacylase
VIDEGAFADIVIFDPDTIADRATFAEPQQHAVGIEHVIVNGTPIVVNGTPIDRFEGPLPGRALRYRA